MSKEIKVKSKNENFATFYVIAETDGNGKIVPDAILFTNDKNEFIVESTVDKPTIKQDGFDYILSIKKNPNIKNKLLEKDNEDFREKILKQYNYELLLKLFSKNEIDDNMINNTVLYLKAKDFEHINDGRRKSKSKKRTRKSKRSRKSKKY